MEGTIGEVRLFAGNFAPQNWMFCQGQILPIAQNTALFSVLGVTYGGNGTVNFALPDLRGRAPVGTGQSIVGFSNVELGSTGGHETTTLLVSNLPPHSHGVKASNKFAGGDHPSGKYLGASASDKGFYDSSSDIQMAPDMIAPTGSGLPFDNRPPYLGINYIICINGYFPSRG